MKNICILVNYRYRTLICWKITSFYTSMKWLPILRANIKRFHIKWFHIHAFSWVFYLSTLLALLEWYRFISWDTLLAYYLRFDLWYSQMSQQRWTKQTLSCNVILEGFFSRSRNLTCILFSHCPHIRSAAARCSHFRFYSV